MQIENDNVIELARRPSDDRASVARRLAVLLDGSGGADELAAQQLARQLASDAVAVVREALALSVRRNRFLPKDIAERIVADVESVACPFIEVTEVFADAELAEIAGQLSEAKRASMASRAEVSQPLCRTLTSLGDARTAQALARNPGAKLSDSDLDALLAQHADNRDVVDSLAQRETLPESLVCQLLTRATNAVAERLAARFDMTDYIAPLAPEAHTTALMETLRACDEDELMRYVRNLHIRGELCSFLILRALREGWLELFEAAMAARAGIPLENARRLTREGGRLATSRLLDKTETAGFIKREMRELVESLVASRADLTRPASAAARA